MTAAQLRECVPPGEEGSAAQTFRLENYDAQGFPTNFPVRTTAGAPGGSELCLQPQIVRVPHFDAVAFEQPDKSISLVMINIGDSAIQFTLVDKDSKAGIKHLTLPSHAIHTYRWMPGKKSAATLASTLTSTAAVAQQPQQVLAAAAPARVADSSVPTTCGVAVDVRRSRGGVNGIEMALPTVAAGSADSPKIAFGRWSTVVAAFCVAMATIGALTTRAIRRNGAHGAPTPAGEWEACEVARTIGSSAPKSAPSLASLLIGTDGHTHGTFRARASLGTWVGPGVELHVETELIILLGHNDKDTYRAYISAHRARAADDEGSTYFRVPGPAYINGFSMAICALTECTWCGHVT